MKKSFTKKLSLTLLFLAFLGGGLVYWQNVQGVNRTWDGGGVDGTCGGAGTANNWSCPANWSSDTAPTASDVAIFDGTSTKDATINANISVAGISINAGYTGTITQSSTYTVTVGSSHYSQAAGTFTGGSGTIDINGTFTLSGGTFTSTSGTLEVGRNIGSNETILTVSSGTFSHNNGTVKFNPSGNGFGIFTADINTTLTLYNIEVSNGLNLGDVITTGSGDTIIAINDFTHTNSALSGSWEVQGNVVIGSSADGGTGTLTMTGTGSKTYTYTASGIAAHLRINNATLAVTANTGTTALRTTLFSVLAGTFTAPTGTLTIGTSLTASQDIFNISSGATFIHNAGTVEFIPYFNSFATFYVNVDTTQTFHNVTINIGNNQSDVIATGSGDTITVANNFTHTNGKIAGTWEVQGNYTVATTADGGTAGITFTGSNNQVYTDSGGNESDGDVLVNKSAGTVTLASNADWNAASQDATITGGTLASATYNITTNSFTVNGGTFTGGSGTVMTSGPMVVSSGTFTGGTGDVTVNSTFTLSGGTFTSTSGVLKIYRTSTSTIFTVSGGTFNHNNGTFQVDGSGAVTLTLDVPTTLMLYNIVINTTGYQHTSVTTAAGDTIIAENDFTHTSGTLQGTWEVQGDVIIGSLASYWSGGTLTYTTGGAHTYAYTAGGFGPHLRVNHASAVVTPASGTTNLNLVSFSLLAGTFTAPTGTLETYFSFNSTSATVFSVASGTTFNHNNGTLKIAGGDAGTFTLDVPTTLTLYDVVIDTSVYCFTIVTTASGDTITTANNFTHTCGVLGGTWQVQGNYTVGAGAGAGGAGITFTGGNNQIYTDLGGDEANGDVTINKTPGSSVRLASNADWNSASQDVTITSGELNMGTSANLSTTALTIGVDGYLSNNGTGDLTLAGNVSNSGNLRFLGNGTCGGADSISIASSSAGVQRTWSGAGTYLFHDVTVRDQGGSSAITAYSSTSVSGNGGNWTFSGGACPAQPPAVGLSTGKINMQSGKINLR